ncbi:MAG: hypothetical protein V7L20_21505 [Nostoc sp.]|uniref:hypothetical protein n=1 Tax=Nostoc sp. TaxID=1180 RepID=UPI002FFB4222
MNTISSSSDDLNTAFARLQAILWDTLGMGEKDERPTELMLEFLSRVRQWAKFLQSETEFRLRSTTACHCVPSSQ